eukprot:905778-Pelagomonas_calceolata.AAC.2
MHSSRWGQVKESVYGEASVLKLRRSNRWGQQPHLGSTELQVAPRFEEQHLESAALVGSAGPVAPSPTWAIGLAADSSHRQWIGPNLWKLKVAKWLNLEPVAPGPQGQQLLLARLG